MLPSHLPPKIDGFRLVGIRRRNVGSEVLVHEVEFSIDVAILVPQYVMSQNIAYESPLAV
jgi:hypothetical protein